MSRKVLTLFLAALFAAAADAETAPFGAVIEDIAGANVYRVRQGEDARSIILFGAICPPADTAEGRGALAFASGLIAVGDAVTVLPRTAGPGAMYADLVLKDGRNLAHELLRNGWAQWDRNRAKDDAVLGAIEAEARENRLGRWSAVKADGPAAPSPFPSALSETADASPAPMPEPTARRKAEPVGLETDQLAKGERDVYTDANGVTHFRAKGATDPAVIAEARRQTHERLAQAAELRRQQEAELRREYEAYVARMQAQAEENRRATLEYQDWLLDLEKKALENEAIRRRNDRYDYWNTYPIRHYGNYPILYHVPTVRHDGVIPPQTNLPGRVGDLPPLNHGAVRDKSEQGQAANP